MIWKVETYQLWSRVLKALIKFNNYWNAQQTHCLNASWRIGGKGSLNLGISAIIFCEQSSNSLAVGFSLPMVACKRIREFLITSWRARVERGSLFLPHSFTVGGITSFRLVDNKLRSSAVPSTTSIIDD